MIEQSAISAGLLSRLIRGEAPAEPELADAECRNAVRQAAMFHGVPLLIARGLRRNQRGNRHLLALGSICAEHERREAAAGLIREKELTRTIDALAERGVFPLLMKGTPLAYSHYPSPEIRARADTDMLIAPDAREPARAALHHLGYRVPHAASDRSIQFQIGVEKRDRFGVVHVLDVHWKLSSHRAFADLFSYDALARSSVPVARAPATHQAMSTTRATPTINGSIF